MKGIEIMPRYIDADRAIRDWCGRSCGCDPGECGHTLEEDGTEACVYVDFLNDQPTADVREVIHAHWGEADKYGNRICSNCKSVEHVPTLMGEPIVWDFCPNCGAQMDERRENE